MNLWPNFEAFVTLRSSGNRGRGGITPCRIPASRYLITQDDPASGNAIRGICDRIMDGLLDDASDCVPKEAAREALIATSSVCLKRLHSIQARVDCFPSDHINSIIPSGTIVYESGIRTLSRWPDLVRKSRYCSMLSTCQPLGIFHLGNGR